MTAIQSLKIYEILNKHFKSTEDAKIVVSEIEQIIEAKVEAQKDVLSTKEDLLITKMDLIDRINKAKTETIIWIVSIGVLQFILSILAKKFF